VAPGKTGKVALALGRAGPGRAGHDEGEERGWGTGCEGVRSGACGAGWPLRDCAAGALTGGAAGAQEGGGEAGRPRGATPARLAY
jgi:hypothetical protein